MTPEEREAETDEQRLARMVAKHARLDRKLQRIDALRERLAQDPAVRRFLLLGQAEDHIRLETNSVYSCIAAIAIRVVTKETR